MSENNTRVWEISLKKGMAELFPSNATSMDSITGQLQQGLYSTFRTFDGGKRVLGLQAHLKRLYQPAIMQPTKPAVPVEFLRRCLAEILKEYPDEVRVRVIVTRDGQVYVVSELLKSISAEKLLHGVKVITTDVQRESPRLKSTIFIQNSENVRAQIAESEVFEGLLMQNGRILEGITSNFFYVKDGILGTARNKILLGVTRRSVLRVARGSGIGIVYRPLKRKQVPDLSEAFLTSSSRGIVPIVQVDEITVGKGVPGPFTKTLSNAYREYVMRRAELIA